MRHKKNREKNKYVQLKAKEDHRQVRFSMRDLLLHELMFLAIIFYSYSALEVTTDLVLPLVITQISIVYIHIKKHGRIWRYVSYSLLGILVLLFISLQGFFMNGLFSLYEQITQTIMYRTGAVLPVFEITMTEGRLLFAEQLFVTYVCIGIVLLTYWITKLRSVWSLLFIVFIFILVDIIWNISPHLYIQFSSFVIFTLLWMNFLLQSRARMKEVWTNIFLVFFVFGVVFISIQWLQPYNAYEKQHTIQKVEQSVLSKIDSIRFNKEGSYPYTFGDFSELGELQIEEDVELEVIMSNPSSLYLRGFVGATYTSNRWEELTPEMYGDSYSMLYWLGKEGFHPLTQLHTVKQLVLPDEKEENKIAVQNVQGNSNYYYTPYELVSLPKEELEHLEDLEQTIVSNEFFGTRSYTYEASPQNVVTKYPSIAKELYKEDKSDVEQYQLYESYYNEFVYDHYTILPDNISLMLESHIGSVHTDEGEHVPYEWAINKITSYLEKQIQYDEKVKQYQGEKDFLMHVLEDERKGYAPHFATAATAMFRQLGIPARYVEGYIISPDLVKAIEPYEKIALQGKDAHAWVEIYIDQIGWIPVEVTPGFEDAMEKIDTSEYPSAASDTDIESMYEEPDDGFNDAKQEIQDETQLEDINNEPKEKLSVTLWIIYTFLFLIILAIILYVIYIFRRRISLKHFIQSFTEEAAELVVPRIFSYVVMLISYDGIHIRGGSVTTYLSQIEEVYGTDYKDMFYRAWKLNQLALYSKSEVTEENRETMLAFYEMFLQGVLGNKSMYKKFMMKYIHIVYK